MGWEANPAPGLGGVIKTQLLPGTGPTGTLGFILRLSVVDPWRWVLRSSWL